MTTKAKIAPCLWFDKNAEEAARFYAGLFPDSRIDHVHKSSVDWPAGKAGETILVDFTLLGQSYQALNGGANESGKFNQSVSLAVTCKDQAEVDRYWAALTSDGGEPIMCGWLKDRYGIRWQIVPEIMIDMMMDKNTEKSKRAMEAMMQMVKLDIGRLKAAFEGKAAA